VAPPPEPDTHRVRNPRGQGDRLRVELLDAAAELMAVHGSIDKVGVRAVAAAAGVSPTAVYRHFESHTDLLWAAVQYSFDEFARAMAGAAASADDPYERLAAMGEAYMQFARDHRGKYRVMFSNRVPLPPRTEPVGMHAFDQLVAVVTEVLAARDDDRDPRFVSVQVWTWMHGIVDLMGSHGEVPDLWPDPDVMLAELRVRLEIGPRQH
jgi:AcrR family transcriptional regulator